MRNYKSLTITLSKVLSLLLLFCLTLTGCDKKSEGLSTCNPITLGKPFLAKIGDKFCIPTADWEITFGPVLEDSRCNVPGLECFWEGRYVMAVTIDHEGIVKDTFYAEGDWRDTLVNTPYSIELNKVYPEIRESLEPLDTAAYSFDIIIK